jgi:hypothetical protein
MPENFVVAAFVVSAPGALVPTKTVTSKLKVLHDPRCAKLESMQPTMSHRMTVFAVLVEFASLPLTAQYEPTLREMANSHGGITRMIQSCGPLPSLADVVKGAELIVEGVVTARASYLTADERDILTDYDLAIRQVLFQREMLVSSRPGIAMPLIFKSHGGQIVVSGLRLAVDVQANSARVTLKEGDHVFLFAMRDRKDDKWLVKPFDVFKVNGMEVVPPSDFSDLPMSLPVDTFVQLIYGLQRTAAIRH